MKKKAPKTKPTQPVHRYAVPLETTVFRCSACRRTVEWDGPPTPNRHVCGTTLLTAREDAYTMDHHPTPHGARRD